MKKYKHKPNIVEAVKFAGTDGGLLTDDDVKKFMASSGAAFNVTTIGVEPKLEFVLNIKTPGGWRQVKPGQWMVRSKTYPRDIMVYADYQFVEDFEECTTKSTSRSRR